jgi:hypothetical protein
MVILAGILLALGALLYVALPFITRAAAPLTDGPDHLGALRELQALRDVAYESLRDLEFDYHAGKIGEEDYHELGDRFQREAIDIVTRIESLEAALPKGPRQAGGGR